MNGRGGRGDDEAAAAADVARAVAEFGQLDARYRDCLRACTPPNPQFERERIIASAPAPREWVYVLGLLSEGENEAGLLLELIAAAVRAEPLVPVGHLVAEAWYYLRTSIDPEWQLDDEPPSATATLRYLLVVLDERRRMWTAAPAAEPLAATPVCGRAALLRALRASAAAGGAFTPERGR